MKATQEQLRALFIWNHQRGTLMLASDPETPAFRQKHPRGWVGEYFGERVLEHRAILKFLHNIEPEFVWHENGNLYDNRLGNLTPLTRSQLALRRKSPHNTSGVVGVTWHKRNQKWVAYYRKQYLGIFAQKSDAISARRTAESQGI